MKIVKQTAERNAGGTNIRPIGHIGLIYRLTRHCQLAAGKVSLHFSPKPYLFPPSQSPSQKARILAIFSPFLALLAFFVGGWVMAPIDAMPILRNRLLNQVIY